MGEPILDEAEGIHRDQTRFKEVQAQLHQGLRPIKEWFSEFREEDHAPDPLPAHDAALEAQERALEDAGAEEDAAKGYLIPASADYEVAEVPPDVPTEEVVEALPPAPGEDVFAAWREENGQDHRRMLQCLERMEKRLRNAESLLEAHGIRQAADEVLSESPKRPPVGRGVEPPAAKPAGMVGGMAVLRRPAWKGRGLLIGVAAGLVLLVGVPGVVAAVRKPASDGVEDPSIAIQKGLQGMADYVRQETSELQAILEIPKAASEYLGTLEEMRKGAPEGKKAEVVKKIVDQKEQLSRSQVEAEEALEGLKNLARVSGLSGPKAAVEVAARVPAQKRGDAPKEAKDPEAE